MSIKEHPPQNRLHVPVLLESVLQLLNPQPGENYLDLTAGYGGHASEILARTENYKESVLVDRDEYAITHLKSLSDKGASLLQSDFASAARLLVSEGKQFNIILIDLGVSSPQLDQSERGFSFTNSGPLDMRMDRGQTTTAGDLVNTASEYELTRIINEYGDEPMNAAHRIAQAIIAGRPLSTTGELAELIKQNYRGKWKRIHPATRTFQALRIAVNNELGQVEETLPNLARLLKKDGRVGIISFHSLEDRLVKRYFKEQTESGYEAELVVTTKKAILGSASDTQNPRARSSRLRVAVKK